MKTVEVVAAVIKKDNLIFCAKRSDQGEVALKWEFPGGKIEPLETHQAALIREIKEELNSLVSVGELVMTVMHQYKEFHITMHAYYCKLIEGNLDLTEHVDSCWLDIRNLEKLDWAKADIPIVEKIKEDL
ncbi:(deoxy)nucleoside triphosphate pyrophosphohydrolase [Mycoplasmatota bacterium WC44]